MRCCLEICFWQSQASMTCPHGVNIRKVTCPMPEAWWKCGAMAFPLRPYLTGYGRRSRRERSPFGACCGNVGILCDRDKGALAACYYAKGTNNQCPVFADLIKDPITKIVRSMTWLTRSSR